MAKISAFCALAAAAALTLPITGTAEGADSYPNKPIHVVVPFPAGQGADILMRVVAEQLAPALDTNIIVENRPGGGGVIGAAYSAKQPADGYHFLVASSGPLSIAPHLNSAVTYDVLTDFTPIANLAAVTQVMVTAIDGPYNTLADVIEEAKQTGSMQFASSGLGSTSHLVMEYFAQTSDLDLSHIPYKGGPPAMIDVIGQRVPIMFDALPGVLSNVKGGQLRALAVSSAERSPYLPEIPTIAESGVSNFGAEGWIGLVAPAGVDPAIVSRVNQEINRILSEPATQEKLSDLAFRPLIQSPEEFSQFIKDEFKLWGEVVKEADVTVQ